MRKKHWLLIGIVVVVIIFIFINARVNRGKATPVRVEKVKKRDLSMIISASGRIKPKKKIDVTARSMGKVTRVAVEEGDFVRKGQFLLEIDPTSLRSTVEQLDAAIEGAKAERKKAFAQLQQAKNELDRVKRLFQNGYVTDQEVDNARANYEIAVSRLESAEQQIKQYEADLKRARHNLDEVTINAEMDGIVTRLNVEQGESAIMGTTNIPGTMLLTIADMSVIETEVEVDETEVVHIKEGDSAGVTLDAFPDTTYRGVVTEIGNSPISTTSGGQQGVDFEVVITIVDSIPHVRPGLSADTEIIVEQREDVLSIPIQSLTVRQQDEIEQENAADSLSEENGSDEVEGVFVVEDSRGIFKPVKVGISGESYFEVLSGLEENSLVVSGNFEAIRELKDGERVKVLGGGKSE